MWNGPLKSLPTYKQIYAFVLSVNSNADIIDVIDYWKETHEEMVEYISPKTADRLQEMLLEGIC